MGEKSRLRQALSKWADSSEAHQRDLRQSHATEEAMPIADAPEREQVVEVRKPHQAGLAA